MRHHFPDPSRETSEKKWAKAPGGAEELGSVEELMLFLPMPSFLASADEERRLVCFSYVLSSGHNSLYSFHCGFLNAHKFTLRLGLGGGQRGA